VRILWEDTFGRIILEDTLGGVPGLTSKQRIGNAVRVGDGSGDMGQGVARQRSTKKECTVSNMVIVVL
jgi:hypothetical protein